MDKSGTPYQLWQYIGGDKEHTFDYAENPDKTLGGELIAAFECAAMTVESEFLLSKRLYEQRTGRNQGQHDIIGYQIRQSFKPGEVTAEGVCYKRCFNNI